MTWRRILTAWVIVAGALTGSAQAETVLRHEQTVQRGSGSLPALHVGSNDILAAMRGADHQLIVLHFAVNDVGKLTARHKINGSRTVGHDVVQTLWNTVVTASLEQDRGGETGALTLDSFQLDEGEVTHLHRLRAEPGRGPVLVQAVPQTGNDRPRDLQARPQQRRQQDLRAPAGRPPSGAGGQSAGKLTQKTPPGVYARAVALHDVSIFTPDGGMASERVLTAILDADNKLRLDTWELNEKKEFSHLHQNTEAGQARKVAVTDWNGGVVTAVVDSGGKARFIAWEVTSSGQIVRRGTATYVAVTDIDVARFSTDAGEDRYVAAMRDVAGKLRVLLAEVDETGMGHRIVAKGTGGAALRVSVSASAAFEPEDLRPDSFYTAARDGRDKLHVVKWYVDGAQLKPVVDKRIADKIGDVSAGLYPYFAAAEPGTDILVTLARDEHGDIRVDMWSSYFREIAAAGGLKAQDPLPQAAIKGLAFSPNSLENQILGDLYPKDMPPVRFPSGFEGCSRVDQDTIKRAWARAHHHMWRVQQTMQWLSDNDEHRGAAWLHAYNRDYGARASGFTNYTPRAWFGSYDGGRFRQARRAIDKVWDERFLGRTFTVNCRHQPVSTGAHPCFTVEDVSANHIVLGTMNLCENWFGTPNDDEALLLENQARVIVHELFHWLKIPKSVYWVSDRHDHWKKCGIRNYRAVRAMYGDRAAYIANNQGCAHRNYKRAVRNNDNYAYFARELGRRVYSGELDQFPAADFWP